MTNYNKEKYSNLFQRNTDHQFWSLQAVNRGWHTILNKTNDQIKKINGKQNAIDYVELLVQAASNKYVVTDVPQDTQELLNKIAVLEKENEELRGQIEELNAQVESQLEVIEHLENDSNEYTTVTNTVTHDETELVNVPVVTEVQQIEVEEIVVEEVVPEDNVIHITPVDNQLSDLVASINSTLNTFENEYTSIKNDTDALYVNLDDIEDCIEQLQEYQAEHGSTSYTRKALVKANNLHTKYNERIAELDMADAVQEHEDNESDDDFLDRITTDHDIF